MADITYTILNNTTSTTATINYFTIASTLSQIQHHLKIPGSWNSPFNSTPYTDFTGTSTLRTEVKTYVSDVRNINRNTLLLTTSTTTLVLTSNTDVVVGWQVYNQNHIYSGQTVTNLVGTQTVIISAVPDVAPFSSGTAITFIPPEYLLNVNNTTNLSAGWIASGNGYGGETIVEVRSGTQLVMDEQPNTSPVASGSITFSSNEDKMIEIPPLGTANFAMEYEAITSTLGTYTSFVNVHATLGTPVVKNVNNFLIVSLAPVSDPTSPFYDPVIDPGSGGGADGPGACADSSSSSCSAGGDGGSSCYLTTAASQFKGLDDNCEELVSARMLRDIALSKSKRNRVFVDAYYKIAPLIVERKKDWDDVYNYTMTPMVSLYKNKEYDKAIKLYQKETCKLIKKYITFRDREVIEFVFDNLFGFKNIPYVLKATVLRSMLWYYMTFKL